MTVPHDDRATLTIGQACRAAGVTRKAIRVYERRGLIAARTRTTAGYRLFSDADVDTMRFIRRARTLGLGLDDVADVLALRREGACPCPTVRARITERIREIDTALDELRDLRAGLVGAADVDAPSAVTTATVCPIIETR